MSKCVLLALVFVAILIPFCVVPFSPSDNVIGISDGDTITILQPDKTKLKIRLAEIDCPEKRQPFGTKAKEALGDKIFGKNVHVEWSKKDRYGRAIGDVYLGGRYINKEMVEEGWAWHYTKYSHSKEMAKAEKYARSNKLGLWIDAHPIPPWEFRKK